ncbi:MAG: hypothetical protein AAF394_00665 [Planctomycetota bacterium]
MENANAKDGDSRENQRMLPWKKRCVKLFVLCVLVFSALDSLPNPYALSGAPRQALSAVVNTAGIWQGAWSMFAPDPMVNHLWLSADIYDEQGQRVETWNSPYWNDVGAWEKFYKFRYLNYYTRMCSPLHRTSAKDLADYLARTKQNDESGQLTVEIYANSLELTSPVDGNIYAAEDLVWVTESRQLNDPWSDLDLEHFTPPMEITWGSGK